ncbi:uncharacterized protein LTR77_009456 [Saxophila tyrrhenica]|uniref:Fork-head domain-containing protein n=1 Tax=Saxophila tyrrhenica TaxID=1690608 RepID=A0AAV9NY92_9PEZI|nr:hypothetical protein LTR77_009456 [Saxophila tyrrhenica]
MTAMYGNGYVYQDWSWHDEFELDGFDPLDHSQDPLDPASSPTTFTPPRCISCRVHGAFLNCAHLPSADFLLGAKIPAHPAGKRNASSPDQKMEASSQVSAVASQYAPLPDTSIDPNTAYYDPEVELGQGFDNFPLRENPVNDALSRMYPAQEDDTFLAGAVDLEREAANILLRGAFKHEATGVGDRPSWETRGDHELGDNLQQMNGAAMDGEIAAESSIVDGEGATEQRQNYTAYARLVFPDGDYYITTHEVTLGRNSQTWNDYNRQRRAQRELESYRKEPSQPSQPGDPDQRGNGASSSSLEGRPAPPSAASEHGGLVYYSMEPEMDSGRMDRVRKRMLVSKSSSTTSVAPASLHNTEVQNSLEDTAFDENGEPLTRTSAFVPVHPAQPEDIRKISREHLTFRFNFQEQYWELQILGNNVFINSVQYFRGDIVPINHNDEILLGSLMIFFKLPDNPRRSPGMSLGTFASEAEDNESELSDEERDGMASPVRRLSNAFDLESEEDEVPEEEAAPVVARPKLKLKVSKPSKAAGKSKKSDGKSKGKEQVAETGKKPSKKPTPVETSPEAAKKPEKGKKPKAAAKEPKEPKEPKESAQPPEADRVKSPEEPLQIEPGSALASIPVGELPEKRKGPGRPPKNGLISKRDQALVAKKQKEFEKRGEEAPPYKQLIDLVRAETKMKENAQKIANGTMSADSLVVPSIEGESNLLPKPTAGSSTAKPGDATGATASASAEPIRRSSPKPKRTAKSPSPVKPREHFTEEQLKKPGKTYMYILDDLLSEHPDGQADLQEIYDLIMKKYPFFRYQVGTHGWQSSVRHNLLQHDRFMEVGKSGKGKFWAINPEIPLEREKKRRMTPPPARAPMPNGQFLHPPPGQPPYGHPYAQNGAGPAQFQGGQGYYSPYPPGQPGAYPPPGQQQTYPRPSQQRHAQAQANQNPQRPPPPPQPFQTLVSDILEWRQKHLAPWTRDGVTDPAKAEMFKRVMDSLSNQFHGVGLVPNVPPEEMTDADEREIWLGLREIFRQHKDLGKGEFGPQGGAAGQVMGQGQQGGGSVTSAVGNAVENGQGGGMVQGGQGGSGPPPPPAQAMAPQSMPAGPSSAPTQAIPTTNGQPQPTGPQDGMANSGQGAAPAVQPPAQSYLPPQTAGQAGPGQGQLQPPPAAGQAQVQPQAPPRPSTQAPPQAQAGAATSPPQGSLQIQAQTAPTAHQAAGLKRSASGEGTEAGETDSKRVRTE